MKALFHHQVGKIRLARGRFGYGITLRLGPRSRYGNTSEEGNTIIRARKAYHEKTFYEVRIETTIFSISKRSKLPSPSLLRFGRYASLLLVLERGQRGESLLTQELIRPWASTCWLGSLKSNLFSDLVCSPCLEVGLSLWCYPSLWLRSPLSCSIQIRFWGLSQLSHPPGKRVPRVRRLPLSDRGALISCNTKESSGRSRSLTKVRDATKTRNWKHISGSRSSFFFLLFDPKFSSLFV